MQSAKLTLKERSPSRHVLNELSLSPALSLPVTPELLETQIDYNFRCQPLFNTLIFDNNSKRHQTSDWMKDVLLCTRTDDIRERFEFVGDALFNLLAYRWGSHLSPGQVDQLHVSQVRSNAFLCQIGTNLRFPTLLSCEPHDKAVADRVEVLLGALYFDAGFSTAKRVTTELVRVPFLRTFGVPLPYSDNALKIFWQVSSLGSFVMDLVIRAEMLRTNPKIKFTPLRAKYVEEGKLFFPSSSTGIRLKNLLQLQYEVGIKFQQKGLTAAAEIVKECRQTKWKHLDAHLPRRELEVPSNLWRTLQYNL